MNLLVWVYVTLIKNPPKQETICANTTNITYKMDTVECIIKMVGIVIAIMVFLYRNY